MLIICTVAADFVNQSGERFSVKGNELGLIKEAPEWITKTLLFRWMEKDGSVQFVTKKNQKEAENDPLKGINAEGKKVEATPDKGAETPDTDGVAVPEGEGTPDGGEIPDAEQENGEEGETEEKPKAQKPKTKK